jgi:hypothetical protein
MNYQEVLPGHHHDEGATSTVDNLLFFSVYNIT